MKIRVGISTKLIFMVTVIVIAAIGVVVYIASNLFTEESVTRVQETNKDFAESLADQTFGTLKQATEKMTLLGQTVAGAKGQALDQEELQMVQNILRSNDELLTFGVYRLDQSGQYQELFFATKPEVLAELDATEENLKSKPFGSVTAKIKKNNDQIAVVNSSPFFSKPILTLGFLTKENSRRERWLLRSEFRQDSLIKLFFKKSYLTSYMVDSDGTLLVHSDPKLVMKSYDFSQFPIVQKFKEGKLNNHQMEFEDSQGDAYLGAFKATGLGGTAVVAQVQKSYALAAVMNVQYRALLVTAMVVGIAFILNFLFSKSMTSPLSHLYQATERVADGHFDVKIEPETNDEIGALTQSFKKMVVGLKERDKLKTTFDKFHSKEIAKKILSGEIKLGGERRVATVFFSDIRGFTTMSEQMTPDEVVRMLNEYMTEMVKVIAKFHGVVDKYVGDAIMALWGVPNSTPNDTYNAVCAALEMRKALKAFNDRRARRNKPELKIGMGINTGEVVAGQIGSTERLEYTVIGDAVNQASRIESSTKEIKTDLLISDSTFALVRNKGVVAGPPIEMKVKGKSKKVIVHQVIGREDANGVLLTDLSRDEQDAIMKGPQIPEENTPSPAQQMPQIASQMQPQMYAPVPAPVPGLLWFLIRNPQMPQPEGPYSADQMKLVISQPGFAFTSAYVYRQGDQQMVPLGSLPEFARRSGREMPPITATLPPPDLVSQAEPQEWYIYGDENNTYGPCTVEQLRQALEGGNITRTTYVWKQGLQNWIYVYQVPGFERRAQAPVTGGPLPVPFDPYRKIA